MKEPNRFSLILVAGTLLCCAGWVLVSYYLVPPLIRSVYYGSSWSILNGMITGQSNHSLSTYLTAWNVFSWRILLVLLLFGLVSTVLARPEVENAFWGPEPVIVRVRATPLGVSAHDRAEPGDGASLFHPQMALWLGAVLALSLVLRMLFLGTKSLAEDEIMAVLLARSRLLDAIHTITSYEANMALYYGALRFWLHVGQSEFAIRTLSVMFGVGGVVAMYALGARAFRRQVGIISALLLAINGFHIEYSQEARSYSLVVSLVTLSSLFFLKSVHEGSKRNWTGYIVTSALAIYAHIFAYFVFLAHWFSLLFLPRQQAPWRRLISSSLAIGALGLPMELFLLFRNRGQLAWVPKMSLAGFYDFFACFAGTTEGRAYLPWHGTSILLCAYAIPIIVAMATFAKSRSRALDGAWNLAFIVSWLWVPILVVLLLSFHSSAFWNRFLIICLPPFVLLAAYGLSEIRQRWIGAALLVVIAALTAPGLVAYYKNPFKNLRGMTQYVVSNQKPGDALLFCPAYYESRFTYYADKEQQKLPGGGSQPPVLLPAPPLGAPLQDFLQSLPSQYNRIWFISDDEAAVFDPDKRVIRTALAKEFPGPRTEKRFPSVVVVVLYQK